MRPSVQTACSLVAALLLAACSQVKPQRGGASSTTLGGTSGPTVVTAAAPENPQTPSTQTVEKTTVRVYELPPTIPATAGSQGDSAREQPETSPRRASAQMESRVAAATVQGASPASAVRRPAADAAGLLLREEVTERATTTLGTAQKDTARDLGARLANLRGVMWAGVLLLIGGPILGWKLGWFTNGLIAGAVGLLLIILSTVIPGHEAWFGLFGLGAIPVVAFVYYRAHHDAAQPPPSSP